MKNLELFEKLVNKEMENVQEIWSDSEDLKEYSFGWLKKDPDGGGIIGSLHARNFYLIDEIIRIAQVTEVNIYLKIGENLDGIPTPVIRAF